MKKAQISYFIFIALIMLVSYFLITYPSNTSLDIDLTETPVKEIRSYVEGCIDTASLESIFYTALQGGLYNETNNTVSYPFFIIPIYSRGHTNLVPSLNKIEQQLSFSLGGNIQRCVDNFTIFKDKGTNLDFYEPVVKTKILDKQIIFEINFSIQLIDEEKITIVPDIYIKSLISSYKRLYEFADYIATINAQDPENLCISCLVSYGNANNLNVIISNFDLDTISFTIIDNNQQDSEKNLTFRFAHKKNAQEI